MKIIINSDILYPLADTRKPGDVPAAIKEFCKRVGASGHVIVITHTVLLELQRIQDEKISHSVREIEATQKLLDKLDIPYLLPDDIISYMRRDLVAELRSCGADIQVEMPALADFESAHERAALRLPPHARTADGASRASDEMRDLVIWCMAVRMATESQETILISRDKIHLTDAGDVEARSVNLVRLASLDNALHYLRIESRYDQALRDIFVQNMHLFSDQGLPVHAYVHVKLYIDRFVQGEEGLASVLGKVVILESEGNILSGQVKFEFAQGTKIRRVTLSGLQSSTKKTYPNMTIDTQVIFGLHEMDADYMDRFNALKDIFEE